MSLPLDPIPQTDPLIDQSDRMNSRWYRWLEAFVARALVGTSRITSLHRPNLSSSAPATTIFTPTQAGIIFRVSWRARVTTPAGVASSIAVTINWTEGGVACSKAFAAQTGNTTATVDGDSIPIRPDSGIAVQYSTTYASNPASVMQYDLDLVVEDMT